MSKFSKRLEDAWTTITAQEQRIQKLLNANHQPVTLKHLSPEEKPHSKGSSIECPSRLFSTKGKGLQHTFISKSSASSTSHSSSPPSQCPNGTSGTVTGPPTSYFGGRWTAYRADYKKVNIKL